MISDPAAAENSVSAEADAAQEKAANEEKTRIVVGIGDGGPDNYLAALTAAARMSRNRQAMITLAHGCLPRLSITSSGEALERHLAQGRQLLQEAELALSSVIDHSVAVTLAALPQTGIDALLEESKTADVLIVQRRKLTALGRAFSGSTSHTVAAQAACPVIVVRHDQLESEMKGGIVVGLRPNSGSRPLEVAVAEAVARKCRLTAIYVWDLQFSPTFGGRVNPDEEELAEASRWADSFLAEAVTEIAKLHPNVALRARTVRGDIEEGLLQECKDAELLVVGRHRDAQLASIGLGALTRRLIDQAPCPVMITPQNDTTTQPPEADTTEAKTTT
jgi:nucleotide-binding universal stress UspA family protein